MMKDLNKILMIVFLSIFMFACEKNIDKPISTIVITDFSPKSGNVGDEITITGSGFSSNKAEMKVSFAGANATVISSSETEVVVTVPENAKTGKISVKYSFTIKLSDDDFTFLGSSNSGNNKFIPSEGTWIEYDRFLLDENLNQTDSIGSVVATVGGVVVKDGQNATEIIYKLGDNDFGPEINNKYVYADGDALYNYLTLFEGDFGNNSDGNGNGDGMEIPFITELGWVPVFKPNEDSWEMFSGDKDIPAELADSLGIPSEFVAYLKMRTSMNAEKDASGNQTFTINGESLTSEKVVMMLEVSLVVSDDASATTTAFIKALIAGLGIEQIMTQETTYWFTSDFGYLRNIELFPELNEAFLNLMGEDSTGGNEGDMPFGIEEIIVDYGTN